MQEANPAAASDGSIFKTVPVIAVFDAAPVQRGDSMRFRILMLDELGPFSVSVATQDITATAGVQYEPVNGPRSFINGGDIVVQTIDDGQLTSVEFALNITMITPMFIVRARAVGLIRGEIDTGVYTLDVYEEDVYD